MATRGTSSRVAGKRRRVDAELRKALLDWFDEWIPAELEVCAQSYAPAGMLAALSGELRSEWRRMDPDGLRRYERAVRLRARLRDEG